MKLEKLKTDLKENCKGDTALWFSSGKDSLLLLEVMKELRLKFDVLRFDDGWTPEQRKIADKHARRHHVALFSYPPRTAVLFGNGKDITLAAEYPVGKNGELFTIIRDIVDDDGKGKRCIHDIKINRNDRITPPVAFETHILGSKKGDRHYAFGSKPPMPARIKIGHAQFVQPLYEWTDKDVFKALRSYGIDYVEPTEQQNSGNLVSCNLCMHGKAVFCPKDKKEIPAWEWDAKGNLSAWQNRGKE